MSLLETMLKTKISLAKMETYLLKARQDSNVYNRLLNIVKSQQRTLNTIDNLIMQGRHEAALICVYSHVYPRKKDYYIRRNYDYGELWPKVLEEFEKGNIKDVVEYSRKLRKWPKEQDKSVSDSGKPLDTKSENPDKKEKKRVQRASDDSMIPTESYCGSERNKKYWKQLKKDDDDEHDSAIEDFIKYIEEIKC